MVGPEPKVRVYVAVEQASERFLNVLTNVNLPKALALQFQNQHGIKTVSAIVLKDACARVGRPDDLEIAMVLILEIICSANSAQCLSRLQICQIRGVPVGLILVDRSLL